MASAEDASGKFAFKSDGSPSAANLPSGAKASNSGGKSSNMANMSIVIFAAIAILVFVGGFLFFMGSNQPNPQDNPVAQPSEKEVAALVNGKPIYLADANARLNAVPEELKSQFTLRSIVENMVDTQLLLEDAEKSGVVVSETEFNAAWDLQKEGASQLILETGLTEADLKQSLRTYMLIEALMQQKIADIPEPEVTEEEALAYYTENEADLNTYAVQVRASHILVADENLAKEILADSLAGADFNKLAAENSIDTSNAQNGGDLGFFARGIMVKEFEDAAFSADVNSVYPELVKTDFGYHIIKVTGRIEGFEAIKVDIMSFLASEKLSKAQQDMLDAYMAQLRSDAQIEILVQ